MKPDDLMDAFCGLPEDFIARELEYEPPHKRTAFLVSKPFLAGVSTAACLLLIVGAYVGVWSRQQRIEPLPPLETQTTTVMQTETRTETTAQVTTESQTTVKQTEESTKKSETTTISALNSDRSQQPTSAAALLTTVSMPQTTVTIPTQTIAAVGNTEPLTSDTLTPHTVLSQTSLTARIPYHGILVAERTSETVTQTPITTVTQLQTETSVIVTETTTLPDRLPGFRISDPNSENIVEISYQGELTLSPDVFKLYTSSSSTFQVIEQSVKAADVRFQRYYYTIKSTDKQREFGVIQEERASFSIETYAECDVVYTPIHEYPGLFYVENNVCTLFWDDGNYTFMIRLAHQQDIEEEREMMAEFAENFVQTENTL